jgi:AraC-like DNA-binding protein
MAVSYESGAWAQVKEGWRQLHGSFSREGVSVENHEFLLKSQLDWGRSFHRDSVELCLNLRGNGTVRDGRTEARYQPHTVGFYCNSDGNLEARRNSGETHSFITVELWYQAKTLELLSTVLFEPNAPTEFFCQRQKRVARERVERTTAILRSHLCEPPDIEALGAQVGCSPFYLSRLFSKEMGMTIPQYLRQIRMERAAELLLSGRHNVTEAAVEVGYSSLSHFSKAFCTTIGCCPTLFPSAKALVAKFQAQKRSV